MAPAAISPIKTGHIDDVQELVKSTAAITLPDRFIRDETERPALDAVALALSNEIPVINLSKLFSSNENDFQTELGKFVAACEGWGMFQVINHGVELDVVERMEKVTHEFFILPLEEKQKYPMEPGTAAGYGQAFVFSEDQKLDWNNMLSLGMEPKKLRNPKLMPTQPADFCETLEDYTGETRTLFAKLRKFVAMSLGLDGNVMDELFGEAVQGTRMNYYPVCPRPDLVNALSPHSDGSFLTVLQESKGSPVGLQILKDDCWVPVQPIPNSLIIILGETLEVLTNGKYKSVEHRAVASNEKERLSIVTFYAPNYDVELGPLPQLLSEQNPPKFKRYNHLEYNKNYLGNKLQGKKRLEFAMVQS